MKTKLLSLAVALCISQLMMAQFHLGVKAGANITKVDGKSFKEEFNYGYKLDWVQNFLSNPKYYSTNIHQH